MTATTTPARVIFALLVVATVGAFFAAQRLKHTPPLVQQVTGNTLFSPNGDGWIDGLHVSFRVKRSDDVTVDVVDHRGDQVRTLLRDRPMQAYHRVPTLTWNGHTDDGTRSPDGVYRIRVTLRKEGRSVVVPRAFTVDTTPPRPIVTAIGPEHGPGPELLPNRTGQAEIHLLPAGRFAQVLIFKTAPGRPRLVAKYPLKPGQGKATWGGRSHGRPVSAGTYLAVARWRDKAGNLGSSVPLDRRGLPVLRYGETLPGHGGITVRYLEVQPPGGAVPAGKLATIGVDARGACYRWSLRRIGEGRPRKDGRRSCHTPFHLHAPRGSSGVYLFEARTAKHVAQAPIAVRGAQPSPILVVLPLITWQGRNPVDDDGDGAPNLLDRGVGARPNRVLAGGELPAGFTDAEGPLLAFLARHGRRFDVTTDLDLALGRGPQLAQHSGVILPGDVRWLPARAGLRLRRWVRAGGAVFQIGLDSLRRDVSFSPKGRLFRATAPATTDLFGAKLQPIVRRPTAVTNLEDQIQLFSGDVFGGTGVFRGFDGYEATAALGPSEQLAASAVTGDKVGRVTIVAARFGKGLVIRTGLLHFADRLNADDNAAQLVLRSMTLISHR